MPTNTSPEYKKAETAFRRAREPGERLEHLREMLRTIPKHKGTEHVRADIKTKIKELTEELAGPRKTGARSGPTTVFRPEGAGQVALLGPPNSGKSTLHAELTGSHTQTGPYPFTTQFPHPGMLSFEDTAFQLIDLPPLSTEHPVPWMANALQPADGCLFVVDLSQPGCVEQVVAAHTLLSDKRVYLSPRWPNDRPVDAAAESDERDPFSVYLPTLLVINKSDQIADLDEELDAFRELTELDYPSIYVSATTGDGLDHIGPWLFEHLGVVRVYTKLPHQPAEKGDPFTVRTGGTVEDVALMVHKDVAAGLKFARLWGGGDFEGQQVGREHQLCDGDVIELHS